ncbi:MAG: hypothetical protein V1738_01935 [Patescibacteria group bacterium]
MSRVIGWLLGAVAVLVLLASVFFGCVPCRADLALLTIACFALLSGAIWQLSAARLVRSVNESAALTVHMSLTNSLIAAVVMVPLFVLVTGLTWYWVTLFGAAVIVSAEVSAFIQLKFYC